MHVGARCPCGAAGRRCGPENAAAIVVDEEMRILQEKAERLVDVGVLSIRHEAREEDGRALGAAVLLDRVLGPVTPR